jgi:hypothetical protein
MINWRGVAVRLGAGGWLVAAGTILTLLLVGLTWWWSSSRRVSAAAAFLATPLVIPHANQHEFVLAALAALLVLGAVDGPMRRRLAAGAIGVHAVLWTGPVLDAQAAAWLLFAIQLVALAGLALSVSPYFRLISVREGTG